jgi:DNA-binding CsgD family transcriptional regulator
LDATPLRSRLINRILELDRLREEAHRARAGESRIVLVLGQAGIGKSRFVAELTRAPDDEEMILQGECPPVAGRDLPLAPVLQAFRQLARRLDPQELSAILGPARPVLARVIPALGDASLPPDGELSQGIVFEHLLGVLERLGDRYRLTTVVLEDLHWAAPSTWDLVAHLAHNLEGSRMLVIGTARPDEIASGDRADQILAEVRRSRRVETLELPPLGPDEIAELVREVAPDIGPAAIDAIVERADGNPSFAEELAAGDPLVPEAVPVGLARTLNARLGALPEEMQRLLRLASVIGRRVPAEVLIGAAGSPDEVVVRLLRHAVTAGILDRVHDGQEEYFVFRHGLLRDVVYGSLVPGERSRLHGTVARALSADPALIPATLEHAVELATHWRESGDTIRAFPALVKAAAAAEAAYSFLEAHRLYEQALSLVGSIAPPTPEKRAIGFRAESTDAGSEWRDLLARAADAASLAGEPDRAIEHIDAALARTPPGAGATRTLARRARYLLEAGRASEALRGYDELTGHFDDLLVGERSRLLVAHAQALVITAQYDAAQRVGEIALTAARAARARTEEWEALNVIGIARASRGDVAEALAALGEAHRLAEERRSASMVRPRPSRIGNLLDGYLNAARGLEKAGRRADAAETALEGARTAKQLGAEGWRTRMGAAAAWELYHLGRWPDAHRVCNEALTDATGASGLETRVVRARLAVAEGNWSSAEADLELVASSVLWESKRDIIGAFHLAMAEFAYWRRRLLDAAESVVQGLAALRDSKEYLLRAELCLWGVRVATELVDQARLRRAGSEVPMQIEAASRHVAEIRALAGGTQSGSPRGQAILATALAEFGRMNVDDPNPVAWSSAVTAWDMVVEPYPAAYALWRLGEAELARRDRPHAVDRIKSAFALATGLAALPLIHEIEALATRARIDLKPVDPRQVESVAEAATDLGLSARELEVLLLVARGLTNRQLAAELFITEKTAGHHVSNILGKLGVASRIEAAGVAYRAGLVSPDPEPPPTSY